jgi:hemerythrin-like metal-binding protein
MVHSPSRPDEAASAGTRGPIVWKADYALGHPLIDDEHHKLVELADLLYVAVASGHGEEVIAAAFDMLRLYVRDHFAHEEELYRQHRLLRLASHREQHQALKAELEELRLDLSMGFLDDGPARLKAWVEGRLVAHMISEDRKAVDGGFA